MQPVTIKAVRLHTIAMPMVEGFTTSFGTLPYKTCVLVEVETEGGLTGWGEVSAEVRPGYSPETVETALHVLYEFLIPRVVGQTVSSGTQVPALLHLVRGNFTAKHGLESAIWDALAKTNNMHLTDLLSAHLPAGHESRGVATVGVSIGIKPTIDETLAVIEKRLNEGYRRIKLKIKPGWDIELARAVRTAYPDISLMLDANSAYTLDDTTHLQQLDQFGLLMIEQPLAYTDIYLHSKLQPQLQTPICLDESILSADDVRLALELGACKIINLKPARVGGFTESLAIYRVCVEHDVPLWIGGMLESGIGRAALVAFASLPGVTLPCDISATSRYFDPDVAAPAFELSPESTLQVPEGAGIGVTIQPEVLAEASQRWQAEYPYTHPPFYN